MNNLTNGRIDPTGALRIARDIEAQYGRTRLKGGEVLLSLVGTLGLTAAVPKAMIGWNVARAIGVIPVNEEVGAKWIDFCLRSPQLQERMSARATTTVQATLNLKDVRELPIPLPPKAVREEIAHILGTLDDKIELNRQMNETLDEIARTLFTSWFVTFDPVRAKADGRQPEGMDAETAALFPDRFVDSELGPIPEGWEVGTLGVIAALSRTTVKPNQHLDEIFDHYSLPSFDQGQIPVREPGSRINSNKTLVVPNSVLISKLNPHIPRVWLPQLRNDARSICSTEF
ncbi:MAG: restriction endonuclease subunit S, partial [Chloroflexia bacterium]|nr:restriction endonuclease subunit S [Chloroflexia bacterium]